MPNSLFRYRAHVSFLSVAFLLAACCTTSPGTGSFSFCTHDSAPFLELDRIVLGGQFAGAHLALADVDGDGIKEVVIAAISGEIRTVSLTRGFKSLGHTAVVAAKPGFATVVSAVAAFDIDDDDRDEIILLLLGSNEVVVLDGATKNERQRIPVARSPSSPIVTDLDGDGRLGLLIANIDDSRITYLKAVSGQLVVARSLQIAPPINRIDAEDLDGDGIPEVIVSSFDFSGPRLTGGALRVFRGLNTVIPSRSESQMTWRFAVVASRFTDDSRRQLITADTALRSPDLPAAAIPTAGLGFEVSSISTIDADGDGQQDLLMLAYPGAINADGKNILGAVSYREGAALSAPRIITSEFEPRTAIPVLANMGSSSSWSAGIVAIGIDSAGATHLQLLADMCAMPSDLSVVAVGPASQLIQARDGSVPLFSGKGTAIPVTVASRHEVRGVHINAQLVDASGAVLTILPTAEPARRTLRPGADGVATFDVVIPPSYVTAGDLKVNLSVAAIQSAADSDPANNSSRVQLHIEPSKPITFALVHWRYDVCSNANTMPDGACATGAPLFKVPPQGASAVDLAKRQLAELLPTSAIQFNEVHLDDTGLVLGEYISCLSCLLQALPAARARFDAITPGNNQLPAYFMVDSVGGFTPQLFTLTGAGSVAVIQHEVGHMAGAPHVSCNGTPPPADATPNYPYEGGRIGGPPGDTTRFVGVRLTDLGNGHWSVGHFGPETCDLMSYGSPRWPSEWTYKKVRDAVLQW